MASSSTQKQQEEQLPLPPFPPPHHIRLATTSASTAETREKTLERLERLALRAGSGGENKNADILLLPEAFLGGYPRGEGFGCVVGDRSPEGREEFRRYFEGCVDLGDVVGRRGEGGGGRWVRRELPDDERQDDDDGEEGEEKERGEGERKTRRGDGTRERLEDIASRSGVFLVVGVVERCGGSLYCGVVYVDPRKGMVGHKRRKTQPTGSERLIWSCSGAGTLKAVSAWFGGGKGKGKGGRDGDEREERIRVNMAAAICWESYMPLLRQTLYSQNVNLYLAPTADGRDTWMGLMRTVALEGRCAVVSANMCVKKKNEKGSRGSGSSKGKEKEMKGSGGGGGGGGTTTTTRRRSSIIDEDGNEIVLPLRDAGGDKMGDHHPVVEEEEGEEEEEEEEEEDKVKGKGKAEFLSRGGSSIVSPTGEVLAGPQWETEDEDGEILYADVDMRDCVRGRLDLDAAGSYSRNDAFHLEVVGLDLDPLPYY